MIASVLSLSAGSQEGHLACEKLGVGFLVVTISLELCMSYTSSCHHHFHTSIILSHNNTD